MNVNFWLKANEGMTFFGQYKRSTENSIEKLEAKKHLIDVMTHCMHLDKSVKLIGKILFGFEMGP